MAACDPDRPFESHICGAAKGLASTGQSARCSLLGTASQERSRNRHCVGHPHAPRGPDPAAAGRSRAGCTIVGRVLRPNCGLANPGSTRDTEAFAQLAGKPPPQLPATLLGRLGPLSESQLRPERVLVVAGELLHHLPELQTQVVAALADGQVLGLRHVAKGWGADAPQTPYPMIYSLQ